MKLAGRNAEAFLREPDPAIRAVLLFGPDAGLVHERALALARRVVPDLADPFRVAELSGAALAEDPARLADEAAAIAFTGGRRVVRVVDAGDRVAKTFEAFLAAPLGDALVVVEAGELGPRSSLRLAFEEAKGAAAIGCYGDDEGALEAVIVRTLKGLGLDIAPDALDYLKDNLGADRLLTLSELEKLALYVGAGGRVRIEDCLACVGDSAAMTLDDVVYAAASGEIAAMDRALGCSLMAGDAPVSIVRAAQRHLQRLHFVAGVRERGGDVESALKRQRLHFRRVAAFRGQLDRWPLAHIVRALDLLTEAERNCKTTGMPDEAICRQVLLRIASAARGR